MHLTFIEAEDLYKKDPQLKREDVKILQDWLDKQPHLPELEESQVIVFLHSCYYKIEATKKTIDVYFTKRNLQPEMFSCPNENVIRSTTSNTLVAVLPKETPQNYSIALLKLLVFKVESFNFLNTVKVVNLISTLHLHQHGFSDGLVVIFDTKGFSLSHLTRLNLTVLKHMFDHLQEGLPFRVKQIHFVNMVPFMDKILSLLKPLMYSELYNMIQVHSCLDSMYKYVPKECLLEEHGGGLPLCQVLQKENLKNILDNLDFFEWHEAQTVDESKRMENSNALSSGFGMEGTLHRFSAKRKQMHNNCCAVVIDGEATVESLTSSRPRLYAH